MVGFVEEPLRHSRDRVDGNKHSYNALNSIYHHSKVVDFFPAFDSAITVQVVFETSMIVSFVRSLRVRVFNSV
jgi:hypothetical protein